MLFEARFNNDRTEVIFNDDCTKAVVDGITHEVSWIAQPNGRKILRIGDRVFRIDNATREGTSVTFSVNGSRHRVEIKDEQDILLEKLGFKAERITAAGTVFAPMPGRILDILVSPDENVETGQPVAILEAMKMENELKSPVRGNVSAIHIRTGDPVEKNQPLVEIEPRG